MCLSAKYYWHDRKIMVLAKCDEARPRERDRFTLADSIEVDVKGIILVILSDYGKRQ